MDQCKRKRRQYVKAHSRKDLAAAQHGAAQHSTAMEIMLAHTSAGSNEHYKRCNAIEKTLR